VKIEWKRIDWKKIDWTIWKPRLAYAGFAALAFVIALRWTFPSEAVKERLIFAAGARGWQIDVEDVSAGGVIGVRARGVKLENDSGLAIPIDEVGVSLRLLPLLAGRRSVSFDAVLYDGSVEGTADLSGDVRRLVAEVDGVDLGAALPLRKASGVDLLGRLHGTADLLLPEAPGAKPTGRVDARVTEAGLAGGQLPIPAMGGGLALPRMTFGELTAAVNVGDGKATFEKLEAKGGDAEVRADGLYFIVQPRMQFAPVVGKAKVRMSEAFWSKSEARALKGLADAALAQARGADGAWSFDVTGSVGHPRLMPARQAR
jgi:type II secretion system protein N